MRLFERVRKILRKLDRRARCAREVDRGLIENGVWRVNLCMRAF